MRTFEMFRHTDVSGISGTGKVGEGVIFEDGHTVFRWSVHHAPKSVVFYDSYGDFLAISVNAHEGQRTRLVFGDGEEKEFQG